MNEFEQWWSEYDHRDSRKDLMQEAFEAGRKSEREECAKIVDADWQREFSLYNFSLQRLAARIRARGNNGD